MCKNKKKHLNASSKKKILIQQVSEMFAEELGCQVFLEDAYQLGSRDPRPIVIVFNTAEDKAMIFEKKHRLNGLRNENGDKYFLNDYLPPKINEKRRREREIIKQAKAAPKQDSTNKVEYTKQGLKIGPTIYKKRISPPSHTDLLKYKSAEIKEIMDIPVIKGTPVIRDGHVFTPYAVDAQDCAKITNTYLKVRLTNARARHVVCAYVIPGEPRFLCEDSCDDDDYGAGKVILQAMQEAGITYKAIFVVRNCTKQKLGGERFECYTKAAQNVINEHPYNKILKKNQNINLDTVKRKSKPSNTESAEQTTKVYQPRSEDSFTKTERKRGRARDKQQADSQTRYDADTGVD